jgi:hypothetical protein
LRKETEFVDVAAAGSAAVIPTQTVAVKTKQRMAVWANGIENLNELIPAVFNGKLARERSGIEADCGYSGLRILVAAEVTRRKRRRGLRLLTSAATAFLKLL